MRLGQKTFTARRLRRDETLAEKRLWEQLRNRTLDGYKFVRQVPVGPYVADFLCRDLKLVVEVDGATHATEAESARDLARTGHLAALGYRVARFHNDEVINGMDEVLTLIREALAHVPSPSPSRPLRGARKTSPFPASGRGHDRTVP